MSFTNGDTVIRFTTQAGQAYSLWRKNDLQEPAWASLTNDIPGSGSIQSVADPGTPPPCRNGFIASARTSEG